MLIWIRSVIYSLPISPALQEMFLEGLRLVLFTAYSTLLTFLLEKVNTFPNPEIWTMVFTLLLRMADKWKYVQTAETRVKRTGDNTGLAGF